MIRAARYTLGRVHINSCDFSTYSYSFDDTAGDADLSHFDSSVAHDAKQMIPLMRAAQAQLAHRIPARSVRNSRRQEERSDTWWAQKQYVRHFPSMRSSQGRRA